MKKLGQILAKEVLGYSASVDDIPDRNACNKESTYRDDLVSIRKNSKHNVKIIDLCKRLESYIRTNKVAQDIKNGQGSVEAKSKVTTHQVKEYTSKLVSGEKYEIPQRKLNK